MSYFLYLYVEGQQPAVHLALPLGATRQAEVSWLAEIQGVIDFLAVLRIGGPTQLYWAESTF